jgi:hypothetical protein
VKALCGAKRAQPRSGPEIAGDFDDHAIEQVRSAVDVADHVKPVRFEPAGRRIHGETEPELIQRPLRGMCKTDMGKTANWPIKDTSIPVIGGGCALPAASIA